MRLSTVAAKSSVAAVGPPTRKRVPVDSSSGGRTSSRSVATSSEVSASCGADSGKAITVAVDGSSVGIGGVTAATPGVSARAPRSSSAAPSARPSPPVWATTTSGPLNPGPKPSASRSYAARPVVEAGSLPASAKPSRMSSAGTDRAPSAATDTSSAVHGRRCTPRAQRRQPAPSSQVRPLASRRARCRAALFSTVGRMRPPKTPSSAGSSVREATIVTSTVRATASATPWSDPRPRTTRPSRATITVQPAKRTVRPAASSAVRVAVSSSAPRRSSPR